MTPTQKDAVIEDPDAVQLYRAEQFEAMGFTAREAAELAVAVDNDGVLIRPKIIQEALDKGCKHRQAIRVFT